MKKINCISAIFLLISILGYGQINTNVNSAGGTLLIEQPISYTSDNVNANDKAFGNSFPYLATAW